MTLIADLQTRIKKYYHRKLKTSAARGLPVFIGTSAGYFLLLTILEWLLQSSVTIRSIFFFSWLLSGIIIAAKYVFTPLLRTLLPINTGQYQSLGKEIGTHLPEVSDKLLNILQLSENKPENGTTDTFRQAAIKQVYDECVHHDFEKVVNPGNLKTLIQAALGIALGVMMLVLFVPQLNLAAGRLILFHKKFVAPAKYQIVITPGNIRVSKGSTVDLTVLVRGGSPKSVYLYTKEPEQSSWTPYQVARDSMNEYKFTVKNIRSSTNYYAMVENVESESYSITVFDHPVISELQVQVVPPAYSGLPVVYLKDNGAFQCLAGSNATFRINATKLLSQASLIINDSASVPLTVSENTAEGRYRFMHDTRYTIAIVDRENVKNENPVEYRVKILPDAYPVLSILEPEKNSVLPASQRLLLHLKIQDDYGFSQVKLFYRLSASKYEQPQTTYTALTLPFDKLQKEQLIQYIWNLSAMQLATEDVISFYIEVSDNDNVSGPKIVRSEEYATRLPSLQELLKKTDVAAEKQQNELQQTLREATELKQELEKLSKDLKKDKKELSYDEKERVKQAAEKFENLQKKIDNSREQLKKNTEELQQNNLLSKETLQKYMELQDMLKEMSSEDMKKAMEKLQQQLQNLDRKQIQQSLQNMKFDEEMFQKSIERTLNLLKRVQIEQKVDELVKRAEQLEQEQNKVSEESNKAHSQQEQKQLQNKQKEIGKELDQIKQEMKELAEKMQNFKDLPNDKMEDLQKEFDKQDNDQLSEEAEQEMQKQNFKQAQQKQSQISKNMQKMKKNLKDLQSSIMQQQQMKTFQDMARLLNDLIQSSKDEEELKNNTQQGEKNISYNENARRQESIKKNLENAIQNMSKIAQKSFAISPEMGKELGKARQKMDQAISSLQNKNGGAAAGQQGEAMKSLNEAAALLKDNMASMMQQGGQSGGGMSLMQQMGQLSGQQMQLNNQSQQLMQGNNGQMGQQQMAQMQRLAQQQEMIKKSLEQMEKEARSTGQSKRLPGNMSDIARQMDEVISDMKTQKADADILQKQERILSKLLDIQRSLNERDYEKERESLTGSNVNRTSPADLKQGQRKTNKLQDELGKIQQEGYIKDYEDLIRKYLEKLENEQKK